MTGSLSGFSSALMYSFSVTLPLTIFHTGTRSHLPRIHLLCYLVTFAAAAELSGWRHKTLPLNRSCLSRHYKCHTRTETYGPWIEIKNLNREGVLHCEFVGQQTDLGKPNCRQTVLAVDLSNCWSQIVPHSPISMISTRLGLESASPTRRSVKSSILFTGASPVKAWKMSPRFGMNLLTSVNSSNTGLPYLTNIFLRTK